MPQPIPFDLFNKTQSVELCQACLERAATEVCSECGCPLCHECADKHVCMRDQDDDFVFKSTRKMPKGQIPN